MPAAKISLLLPTRGRPALVARLFDSIRLNTRHMDRIEVVVRVDDDDTESHNLRDVVVPVKLIIGPRVAMGTYNSECLAHADGDIVILINDDMVIRTPGWDDLVRNLDNRFPDKIYLGYGNDLYKGRDLCAFPILSRRCCEALVDPFPGIYRGAFIDYHLLDIFRRLEPLGYERICYLEDLVFEHMHFRSGKGEVDATYTERRRFGDDDAFLGSRDARSAAATALHRAIASGQVSTRIRFNSVHLSDDRSLMRATLGDWELPSRWAIRLYVWFLARFGMRWLTERHTKS